MTTCQCGHAESFHQDGIRFGKLTVACAYGWCECQKFIPAPPSRSTIFGLLRQIIVETLQRTLERVRRMND